MDAARWRRVRQITQVLAALSFFLLALLTYRGVESVVPVDLFFRLDPLLALTAMVAARTVLTVIALSAVMLGIGLLWGRAWCGWLCPLGSILDWVSPRAPRKPERHNSWRGFKYVVLFTLIAAALLGNLSFLILDPLTILNRTFATAILPGFNALLVATEGLLYPLAPFGSWFDWLESSTRGMILPAQQDYYGAGWLLASLLLGIVALNWIVPRFWCRYVCPLGAAYALEARIARYKPQLAANCDSCARCLQVCPTGAISISKQGLAIDPAECTVCLDCVASCPQKSLAFEPGPSRAARPAYELTRRQAFFGIGISLGSFALFRATPSARRDDAFLIRPPGARENNLRAKCIRCAECIKVCPTGGLQPATTEAGVEGLWTPILVSRLGYCDYSCNACGQLCPTGAIPALSLVEKRERVIGIAYIDTNRCIPWASYRPCIVCQEMCPVPDKAVKLEEVDVVAPDGTPVHLQRPRIQPELCIGCGICEYQCPLQGPAAIRVYVPTQLPARASASATG